MTIKFGNIGANLGTRFSGAVVREEIISSFYTENIIELDFAGVETVSVPFADECLAKLLFNFDHEEIENKIMLSNASPYIMSVIASAFNQRKKSLSQLELA